MEIIIKPTGKAAFAAMSFLGKNRKYEIVGVKRYPNIVIELSSTQ
jgi:hypothetical protein